VHTPVTEPIAIPAFPPTERPMSVLAAVVDAEAEEEIAADGDVDGKSDPRVEDTVDKEVLLGALVGDVESALDAAFGVLLLNADDYVVVCGSWLVKLFGIVLCMTTDMLVLVTTAVDVVAVAWISDADADEVEEILLMMKGKELSSFTGRAQEHEV
jgi:hypothetical protein